MIVTRNLSGGIFNGTRGTILKLREGQDPIINIDGKTVPVLKARFYVYSPKQQKTLGCRTQYPLQLAFALTVHKAQGQTLKCVEVDCFSFFAPGQMGVAVGRCVNKEGLRVVNFNLKAAHLKHPDAVYAFYEEECEPFQDVEKCCKQIPVCPEESDSSHTEQDSDTSTSNEGLDSTSDLISENPIKGIQIVECPWNLQDFIHENVDSNFLSHIPSHIYDEQNEEMNDHLTTLYSTVVKVISKNPQSPQQWVDTYRNLNMFLDSDYHEQLCQKLFHSKPINPYQNKFSTKLVLWLMSQIISEKASDIIKQQQQTFEDSSTSANQILQKGNSDI